MKEQIENAPGAVNRKFTVIFRLHASREKPEEQQTLKTCPVTVQFGNDRYEIGLRKQQARSMPIETFPGVLVANAIAGYAPPSKVQRNDQGSRSPSANGPGFANSSSSVCFTGSKVMTNLPSVSATL